MPRIAIDRFEPARPDMPQAAAPALRGAGATRATFAGAAGLGKR